MPITTQPLPHPPPLIASQSYISGQSVPVPVPVPVGPFLGSPSVRPPLVGGHSSFGLPTIPIGASQLQVPTTYPPGPVHSVSYTVPPPGSAPIHHLVRYTSAPAQEQDLGAKGFRLGAQAEEPYPFGARVGRSLDIDRVTENHHQHHNHHHHHHQQTRGLGLDLQPVDGVRRSSSHRNSYDSAARRTLAGNGALHRSHSSAGHHHHHHHQGRSTPHHAHRQLAGVEDPQGHRIRRYSSGSLRDHPRRTGSIRLQPPHFPRHHSTGARF